MTCSQVPRHSENSENVLLLYHSEIGPNYNLVFQKDSMYSPRGKVDA